MKFWLTCFGLLFIGAELFQWFAELGGGKLSGVWLILGGMGLAAASNAAHLPKLAKLTNSTVSDATAPDKASDHLAQSQPKERLKKPITEPLSVAQQSAEDSISFKVRLPWR